MGITKELLWLKGFLTNIKDALDRLHHHVVNPLQGHGRKRTVNGSGRGKGRLQVGTIIVSGMLFFAPPLLSAGEQLAPSKNLADLENFVIQDCGSCHGLTLKGGLGPPLRPENLNHLPEAAIAAIIREGIPGTAMPPWKPLLAPADIVWISHQLKAGKLVSP
ncbi:c-type cytochrome [Marinobacter salexigens]|uniref:c-type cytochrome n=1 Tax=Marinobacter salexigens TaxID=1925763 RepID=UPI001EFC48FA|nr:cytochrome c [Marinobacter salexigens]